MRALLVAGLFACGSSSEEPPPAPKPPRGAAIDAVAGDVLEGELVVDGTRTALRKCLPGRTDRVFLDVATDAGTLRFQNQKLALDGAELTCSKLERSWGGGIRTDGTAYWRGTLDFDCGRIKGTLKADCGGITTEERASLDANRAKARGE